MPEAKPTYEELEEKLNTVRRKLEKQQTRHSVISAMLDKYSRSLQAVRSVINMPELYLDLNWNIVGYTNNFLILTKKVFEFTKKRKNIKEFLKEGDFNKIKQYLEKIEALEALPYDEGRKWVLRYKGPNPSDKIGESWIAYKSCERCQWQINEESGTLTITHSPHIGDAVDCYLMSAEEYGGANEDIKIICKVKTPGKEKHIRDLSVVFSGSSGKEEILPDLLGYTACYGAVENSEARIQRQAANIVAAEEVLDPDTEYRMTIERTGGRIRRTLKNLRTGAETTPLEAIDARASYDRQNHVGFTTFSGGISVSQIEIYTRKSKFSIDQFNIPFHAEVGIRDKTLEDRIYKLRIGNDSSAGKQHNVLMFEDITKRKKTQAELERSHEQLRSLSSHLQLVREEERTTIAREIHDELGQILTAMKIDLGLLESKFDKNQTSLIERTRLISKFIDATVETVQKISGELRPRLLDELGLVPAIELETMEFRKRTGLRCRTKLDIEEIVLDWNISTNLFRIFQEALTNITRHAKAKIVKVSLIKKNEELVLSVADNGVGFPEEKIYNPKSFGLMGIRERVRFLGGKVKIVSVPCKGTTINVTVPLNKRVE